MVDPDWPRNGDDRDTPQVDDNQTVRIVRHNADNVVLGVETVNEQQPQGGSPRSTKTTEASMRWLDWVALAVFAGVAMGCSDDNALYTSPNRVPGYTPSGSPSSALAYAKEHGRDLDSEWRER
jgi:hypothetical protein